MFQTNTRSASQNSPLKFKLCRVVHVRGGLAGSRVVLGHITSLARRGGTEPVWDNKSADLGQGAVVGIS